MGQHRERFARVGRSVTKSKRLLLLTRVLGKLGGEVLLSVSDSLHRGQGDIELAIAEGADSNGRDCSQPFEHPQSAFFHGQNRAIAVVESATLLYIRLFCLVLIGSHVNLPVDDSWMTREVFLRQVWSRGGASVDGGRTRLQFVFDYAAIDKFGVARDVPLRAVHSGATTPVRHSKRIKGVIVLNDGWPVVVDRIAK